jgi:hypothetical protein
MVNRIDNATCRISWPRCYLFLGQKADVRNLQLNRAGYLEYVSEVEVSMSSVLPQELVEVSLI